jgi:hypothetical protein
VGRQRYQLRLQHPRKEVAAGRGEEGASRGQDGVMGWSPARESGTMDATLQLLQLRGTGGSRAGEGEGTASPETGLPWAGGPRAEEGCGSGASCWRLPRTYPRAPLGPQSRALPPAPAGSEEPRARWAWAGARAAGSEEGGIAGTFVRFHPLEPRTDRRLRERRAGGGAGRWRRGWAVAATARTVLDAQTKERNLLCVTPRTGSPTKARARLWSRRGRTRGVGKGSELGDLLAKHSRL